MLGGDGWLERVAIALVCNDQRKVRFMMGY